ncbi:hypothetical protein A5714_00145 [Mycobacterium sp. E2462]|uniref:hypothetical protein n=1 Tax=Mycobacterium sp. E2462 TaxID=1834133 RepID=UPI0007FFAEDD|nr:hypothetical protein [Mycobacterium sp. E2462]OBI13025.1 hypothetical protein A5714_00145 [Mycobacterium sp. E2462]
MKPSNLLEHLDNAADYGQPYQTPDGYTVIPVGKPLGVFVIRDGEATWKAAVDTDRIALIGVLTGLVATLLAGLAMLRQPPWPRITLTD